VVALKSPDGAKSGLRRGLCDSDRRELHFIMARRVLDALKQTPAIGRVFVVPACKQVERFARQLGAEVIHQREGGGTASAFSHEAACVYSAASKPRPARLLMIAGDLPLLSPHELSLLIDRSRGQKEIVIVPDRKRLGTNALLCSPPDAIAPCFGAGSFRRHAAAARQSGVAVRMLESEALSLDIDVVEDLALLRAHLCGVADSAGDCALRDLLERNQVKSMPAITGNLRDAQLAWCPGQPASVRPIGARSGRCR
jgi:2-phospho-L-lactate/phosphoenolpyruvate guanylyltransferase